MESKRAHSATMQILALRAYASLQARHASKSQLASFTLAGPMTMYMLASPLLESLSVDENVSKDAIAYQRPPGQNYECNASGQTRQLVPDI